MSETAGTIIKILTALTSPMACVKYMTVALSLFLSWKYLEPLLSVTNITKEQLSIIILLFGVGIGALSGQFISWSISCIWQYNKAKRDAAVKLKTEAEYNENKRKEEEKNSKLLSDNFKNFFEHLHFEQKNTLRALANGNQKIGMDDPCNKALQKNSYIQLLSHVSGADYVAQINPVIVEYVREQWAVEKKEKVQNFIECNKFAVQLLKLFEERNQGRNDDIDKEVLESTSQYSECIKGGYDDRGEGIGYWLWFDDELLEEFEKQTNKSYVDEVFIEDQRIINNVANA